MKKIILVLLALLTLSILFYYDTINDYPKGRHASGMANYYTTSIGFLDNNFDFFHPQTYCLNPQYPPTKIKNLTNGYWNYTLENPQGITSVDFPINQYIVAILMKVFNSTNPIIYRVYTLILSLIGLFYLFKILHLITKRFDLSFVIIVLTFLSPTYSFFANSFLVSSIALSLIFIALFYLFKFNKTNQIKFFLISILFITLSGLIRFPFIIYVIALFIYFTFYSFIEKKNILD